MRSKTLYQRMHKDTLAGYKYVSVWTLTNKTTTTAVRSELFNLHPKCRYYKALIPLLENLAYEQVN